MAEEVYMDIPRVREMSRRFRIIGDVLDGIAKVIDVIGITMITVTWIAPSTSGAFQMLIDFYKSDITKAADKMRELSIDVNDAVNSYQNGDASGSRRFC